MNNKTLLLILDGWGVGENAECNAIFRANPEYWQKLWSKYPHTVLHAREESVGLPCGCLSGSEVAHLTIGAGRIVWQNMAKIANSLTDGTWYDNQVLAAAEKHLVENNGNIHICGLLSDGGIHSHSDQMIGFINWAKKIKAKNVYLHLFLDGRDMPPQSALELLKTKILPELTENIKIATICGRATAMDRSENWDRTITTYNLIAGGVGDSANILDVLSGLYKDGITDEFIPPTRLVSGDMVDGDVVAFSNFRADRMRQMVRLFTGRGPGAEQNKVTVPNNLFLCSLTEYDPEYREVYVMYPPEYPVNTLGEWVSKQGVSQFRLAESEKYAHVTYFFNGGREQVFPLEDRLVVPSLGLTNYASNPEMSVDEVTKTLVRVMAEDKYGLVVCNLANGDMVGHSGDIEAGMKAVLAVDKSLETIIPAAEATGYTVVITADHGNVECMNENGVPHTAHTFNHVPLLITDTQLSLPASGGYLHQIAPTILKLMKLPKPDEMTSESLI